MSATIGGSRVKLDKEMLMKRIEDNLVNALGDDLIGEILELEMELMDAFQLDALDTIVNILANRHE